MRRGKRFDLGYRLVLASIGAGAFAAKALAAARPGTAPPWVQLSMGIGAALMLFVDNARMAWHRYREPETSSSRDRLRTMLYGAIKTISEVTQGIEIEDLGISVWKLQPRRLPLRPRRLRRVDRFRLSMSPQPTEVKWVLPKGAVGRASRDHKKHHRDCRRINAKYSKRDMTAADFATLAPEDTYGFTYEEFKSFIGKYSEILAVPIKSEEGAVIGVISVDRRAKSVANGLQLDGDEVEEVLDGIAFTVVREIRNL